VIRLKLLVDILQRKYWRHAIPFRGTAIHRDNLKSGFSLLLYIILILKVDFKMILAKPTRLTHHFDHVKRQDASEASGTDSKGGDITEGKDRPEEGRGEWEHHWPRHVDHS
jgi:hypothetical protein